MLNKVIRFGAVLGLAISVEVAVSDHALADAFADCVRAAASADMVAKVAFQRDLRNLIVQDRPEFEALAVINMRLQTLLAEARRARFDYLLDHDPGRIDTANGLSRFSNFDWTEADSEKFIAESESFRRLDTRITQMEEQNNAHPDWPQMREHFRAKLSQSPEFNAVMTRFQGRQNEVAAQVAKCQRN